MNGSEIWVMFIMFIILYLFCMVVIVFDCMDKWQDTMEKCHLEPLFRVQEKKWKKRLGHKPRMKYLTNLSCEEVLLRLMEKMYAPFDCTFEKENDDPKNQMYVFSIHEVPIRYYGVIRGRVKYKVMVTPAQEGSAVWLFLFTFERALVNTMEYSNNDILNVFAWDIEKLFGKLLDAVRVE
jgi:hypothetical protein